MDLLQYQIDELESANLKTGEQEQSTQQKKQISESWKNCICTEYSQTYLVGNEEREGVASMLSVASGALEEIEEYLPAVESILNCLREIEYGLEDLREELRVPSKIWNIIPKTWSELNNA